MTRDELVAWFDRRIGPNEDTVTIFAQCSHDGQTARVLAAPGFVNRGTSDAAFLIGSATFDVSALDDAQIEAIEGSPEANGFVIPLAENASLWVRDNANES
jgi:hypothetical protein